MTRDKQPVISVIVPLYNVEKFLNASLDSVIEQTIGFEQNIEIILVDDGSSDKTRDISELYTRKYPENIFLHKQKNSGVGAARNLGLSHARGKYVNFLDADDIWQKNALEKAVKFLETHAHVNVVAAMIKFFDRSIDEHPLNYKFKKTRVINPDIESDAPLLHIISCVIRKTVLESNKFDEKLRIAEDAELLSRILASDKKYGVITGTHYNYRKRSDTSSAIDKGKTKPEYYLVTPKRAYESMARVWTHKGYLHKFMQHTLLYDISYRVAGPPYMLLNEHDSKEYAATMHKLLKRIDNQLIKNSRWFTFAQKEYLLHIKKQNSLNDFGFVEPTVKPRTKNSILKILFDWRFKRAIDQCKKSRSYNYQFLGMKAKLFEALKPLLVVAESVADIPRAMCIRTGVYVARRHTMKDIWIISDRPMAAGDNGEALFKYLLTQDIEADIYFAISKRSPDYTRMRRIGRVLDYGSWKYLILFLLSSKIISSHADIETYNPFIRNKDHYEDLMNFDFVFLQHGVISNDLSNWLNKDNTNIELFITSGKSEYESIVKNKHYGYSSKEVALTGLSRWDTLENRPNRKVIVAPTYRAGLLVGNTKKDGTRIYDAGFKHTEYFKFYNSLVNDDRLMASLRKHNMTCEVYIHPNFAQQINDFTIKDTTAVNFITYPYDYQKALSEGSLLISDYSSVCFDFAYLGKPVIYAQFDIDNFFANHSYERGYFFDYKKHGFGPVTHSYESTVQEILQSIEGGCSQGNIYRNRAEAFFYKIDKNNSQRVLDAIINL